MRLIDADALLGVHGCHKTMSQIGSREDDTFNNGLDFMVMCINNAPTVDPVKHGHWIQDIKYDKLFGLGQAYCSCSICGNRSLGDKEYHNRRFLFCNKCGAKMDEEETSDG